ncbi:MAG TPA: lycopene cyclase family protein [Cytophagaceae bacterium]|jgi:lycopene beta-cyclase|nr:lycopene cyclase family protein [Cytophagaceae bacterium]
MKKYDYIIAGTGLAGLLLALEMGKTSLKNKKVLLVDKESKNSNDRTWCFWSDDTFEFNSIVFKKWEKIRFAGDKSDGKYAVSPYEYKYIRGIDFYRYAQEKLTAYENFEHLQGEITEVSPEGYIVVNGEKYFAEIIFNSLHPSLLTFKYPKNECYHLLQHFKGFFLETEEDFFDPSCATFMDFTIEQHQEARFGYILPFSKREALVEYTLFSQNLLQKEEYVRELHRYITEKLGIKKYAVKHEEFGIVPMSTYSYQPKMDGKIVRIGTYGGFVKPSSGFAFTRTYKRIKQIVSDLDNYGIVKPSSLESPAKYRLYDNILLSILEKDNNATKEIFEKMFTTLRPSIILKFLDEESTLADDLKIISLFFADKRFFKASIKEISRFLWK